MERREFERVTPESVGISSRKVLEALDILESVEGTEPHGIVFMRHGKVFAEGWWSPYGKRIPHELFSMTKTYTATALGIAYTEGLVSLDDRLVDLFPEYSGGNTDERAARIKVRDVLRMASGKPEQRCSTADWARHFYEMDSKYEPGEKFSYSCEDTHSIEAIVQKVTGVPMDKYLNEKLFSTIGIDPCQIYWARLPDGSVIGCGGLFASNEDSMRLIQLYMQGGVWDGERILAEDYVKEAVTTQIIAAEERPQISEKWADPGVEPGYGYQIWTDLVGMSGVFAARGAIGQIGVGIPEKDIVISYTQGSSGIGGDSSGILDVIGLIRASAADAPLPDDHENYEKLKRRLETLSLGNPRVSQYNDFSEDISGVRYETEEKRFTFRKALWNHIADCDHIDPVDGVNWFEFNFDDKRLCVMKFEEQGECRSITISMDGARRLNKYPLEKLDYIDMAYFDGEWAAENTLRVYARWVQTSFSIDVDFIFDGDGVTIEPVRICGEFDAHPLRKGSVHAHKCEK